MGFAPALGAVYLAFVLVKIHLAAVAGKRPRGLLLCAAAPPAALVAAVRPPNVHVGLALGAAAAAAGVSVAKIFENKFKPQFRWLLNPDVALVASALVSAGCINDLWSAVAALAGCVVFVAMELYRDHILGN